MSSASSLKNVPDVSNTTVYETSFGGAENRVRSTAETAVGALEVDGAFVVGGSLVGVS